ncbi:MAG: DUF481 domain-containing protein [Gammaproteobacteria bacterium]|nr:DUF481 domain-containing protein [Gammaproteobacteria bacterium]
MKPVFFMGLLTGLLMQPAHAIVNIENMNLLSEQARQGFEAQLGLDISGKNGNTSNRKAGFDSRFQWFKESHTHFLVLSYEYGESSDVKDTDKSFMHLRHIGYMSDTLAWEAFAQLETNEFTRLSLRSLAGGGVRYKLGKPSASHSLYFGAGLFRSKETLDEDPSVTDEGSDYATRANLYMVNKFKLTDNASLSNTLYYQPDVSDASDYRLLEQFRFKVNVTEKLSVILSLDVSRDSHPPQSIERTDSSYTTGLNYSF